MKSVYNDVWKYIDLRKVWSAMEDPLHKAETPLVDHDSIKLSLKKFRNLGEINKKINADEQRAFLLTEEEERADCEADDSSSPMEDTSFMWVQYRWLGSYLCANGYLQT